LAKTRVGEIGSQITEVVLPLGASPVLDAAGDEFGRGAVRALARSITAVEAPTRDGAVILGTPVTSPLIARLSLPPLGKEGYLIRSVTVDGHRATVIAANADVGVLYGVFHFFRLVQTGQPLSALDIASQPRTKIRLLNHWDNLDQHVERGYAGESIWNWHKLPGWLDPRYSDYARACASIGINGTVLTNVNANATSLTPAYIEKARALAGVMRPYGIRVYLTARFSAPIELGGLKNADPTDPAVRAWW
jgi:alpha-glucuronidase